MTATATSLHNEAVREAFEAETERVDWFHLSWEVAHELAKQRQKWGEQNRGPDEWFLIIGEELGEVAKAMLEQERDHAQREIVQAMACLAQLHHALNPESQ